MAEQQLNAPARARYDVHRSPAGVHQVTEYQDPGYTIVGNHLTQHRSLSGLAIGLAAYIQSLPEGAPVDIRTLAKRFPEGREPDRGRLTGVGGVRLPRTGPAAHRRRADGHGHDLVQQPGGHPRPPRPRGRRADQAPHRRRTTPCHSGPVRVPGPGPASSPASSPSPAPTLEPPRGRTEPAPPPPDVRSPAIPATPAIPGQAAVAASRTATTPALPRAEPSHAPQLPQLPEPATREHHTPAAALLANLRHDDPRLLLSVRDIHRLTPPVAAWLERGASPGAVRSALTTGLPPTLRHPAALLAHRLAELLPPPLPAATPCRPHGPTTPTPDLRRLRACLPRPRPGPLPRLPSAGAAEQRAAEHEVELKAFPAAGRRFFRDVTRNWSRSCELPPVARQLRVSAPHLATCLRLRIVGHRVISQSKRHH